MANDSDAISKTLLNELFPAKLSKADKRRLEIIEGAIRTYSKLGIDYISNEDIAREAGTSRPLLQYHFPDKKDLFWTTIKFIRAHLQDLAVRRLSRAPEVRSQFAEYVRSIFHWIEESPEHAQAWLFFFCVCPTDPDLRAKHFELTSVGQKRIEGLLAAAVAQGLCEPGDLALRAKNVQRLMTGALVEVFTEFSDYKRELERVREETVEVCLQLARFRS